MRRFFRKLSRRRTLERELEAELAFHREMAAAGGNAIPLGNIPRIMEASGDPWRFALLEDFWRDAVYGVRGLRRSPTLVLIAVLSMALGIGSSTAIFSIVDTVLLKPLPVFEASRFVVLLNTGMNQKGEVAYGAAASPTRFAHWRAQSSVLEDVSAYAPGAMNYTGGEVAEQVQSMQASADFFRCMGTPILEGRGFTQEEDSPHGPRVAVISQQFWSRRFAGDPEMLGKTISLSGQAYAVIGIMARNPSMTEFGSAPDVVVPFQLDPNSTDQGQYFTVVARLKPGVSLEQAQERLKVSAAAYRARFPVGLGPRGGFSVMPYREALVGDTRSLLLVLSGAVGLVLLTACANVANLLLAQATARRREIAIRAAIGSGRGRIVRQLLTESLLLSLAGGALGLLLGYAGIRALLAVNTADLPRVGENGVAVSMDWRVLGFALGLSILTGILFGLFPAIVGSRANVNTVLKDSTGRAGTGLRQNKARSALVVSEVSLAVILLVGSALLIRTFVALYAVDRGFDANNVLTMRMSLSGPRFSKSMAVEDAVRDAQARVQALPGVVVATASCCVPLTGSYALPFNILGRPAASGPFAGVAGWSSVSPGYFDVFRIPIRRGRAIAETDDDKSPAVVLINETMARLYWKDGDPLKDRIVIGRGVRKEFLEEPARQIIGIVGDVRDGGLGIPPRPNLYVPQAQLPDAISARNVELRPLAWVVRTQGDPMRLAPAIQDELRQATGLPVSEVHSMEDVVSLSAGRRRFNMLLMTVFGATALFLSAIGIYGVMAYSVEQRTQDFGVRMALGAQARQVRNMVVRQGMLLALAGVVVGIGGAWALARFIESLLFGVAARDPIAFVAVPLVLAAVALLAVWMPANRASRVDPIESLRYE